MPFMVLCRKCKRYRIYGARVRCSRREAVEDFLLTHMALEHGTLDSSDITVVRLKHSEVEEIRRARSVNWPLFHSTFNRLL